MKPLRHCARLLIFVAIAFQSLTACTSPPAAQTCVGAVAAIFPPRAQAEMMKIVRRESGGSATAYNRTVVRVHRVPNHAHGCLQLLLPLHADLYRRAGCDPVTQRFDAWCNVKAAHYLWLGSGLSAWKLTA